MHISHNKMHTPITLLAIPVPLPPPTRYLSSYSRHPLLTSLALLDLSHRAVTTTYELTQPTPPSSGTLAASYDAYFSKQGNKTNCPSEKKANIYKHKRSAPSRALYLPACTVNALVEINL